MRFIRLMGALIIFYGLSYLLQGLGQLASFLSSEGRGSLVKFVFINLVIAVSTITIGAGLLLLKEWARMAWLISVSVLLMIHVFFLLLFVVQGSRLNQQIVNVGLIIPLALISWACLTKPSYRTHFKPSRPEENNRQPDAAGTVTP